MKDKQFKGAEKYEISFLNGDGLCVSVKTNSWVAFTKLRIKKKVIHYKVRLIQ